MTPDTNCLIVNGHYDHQAIRYKRTKKLSARGKPITILTGTQFNGLL